VSSLDDLAHGQFQNVIGEREELDPKRVRRLVLCSGKVYYDLVARRRELGAADTAIVRIEQLYPFPHDALQAQVDLYGKATELMWVQEEPGNQGAWHRIQHYLLRHMRPDQVLAYALRPSSAAPAVGYVALHNQQHRELMQAAFGPIAGNTATVVPPATTKKERTGRALARS
jgi:2-oxoglutarate dehydrogenase E1 component